MIVPAVMFRDQDGVTVAAVGLLGKPHPPTLFTGSTSTYTENTFDITDEVAAAPEPWSENRFAHRGRRGSSTAQHR